MSKINAGVAMVKVLESWGIDHIYGIPGGSFNSIMDALYHEKNEIKYIQVCYRITRRISYGSNNTSRYHTVLRLFFKIGTRNFLYLWV
ncbi:thiamine pyrophosphate-binding protein [Listeria innocua]